MLRWDNGSGPILEWTLGGNIRYSDGTGSSYTYWELEVKGESIDLSGFKYDYASETLAPAIERRGFDVKLPEQKQEQSLLERIKTLIIG